MTLHSIYGTADPGLGPGGDTDSVTVGTIFSQGDGVLAVTATAVRVFIPAGTAANLSGAVAGLFSMTTEVLLASSLPTTLIAGQWNEISLPVTPLPSAHYVVAVHLPGGGYGALPGGLEFSRASATMPLLTTLRRDDAIGLYGQANGRFSYGSSLAFPDGSWNMTFYGVDILVDDGESSEPNPTPTYSVLMADGTERTSSLSILMPDGTERPLTVEVQT